MIDQQRIKDIYRSTFKTEKLPSAVLTKADLRSLFFKLKQQADHARDIETRWQETFDTIPPKELETRKENIQKHMQISIIITATDGSSLSGTGENIFETPSFPENIRSVLIDSKFLYSAMHNVNPQNYFILSMEFDRTPIFDLSDLTRNPNPNPSYLELSGSDKNWVSGVKDDLISFLKERGSGRNCLYGEYIGYILAYFLIFPLAVWGLFRFHRIFESYYETLPLIPVLALNVYIFLVFVFLLRTLFNYSRWLFPSIEYTGPTKHKNIRHRFILGAIILSILGALAYDVIKSIF